MVEPHTPEDLPELDQDLLDEFNSDVNLNNTMMELGEIKHSIEADPTPFLGSLVRPVEYKPGDPDVPHDKIKAIGEALVRLEHSIEEAAKTGYSKVQLEQKAKEESSGVHHVQIHMEQEHFNYMNIVSTPPPAPPSLLWSPTPSLTKQNEDSSLPLMFRTWCPPPTREPSIIPPVAQLRLNIFVLAPTAPDRPD